MYSISLQLGDKSYTGKGKTPDEALASLEKPGKIFSKGLVTVSDGGKTKQMLLTPIKVKQMFFNSPALRAVKAKQLFNLMK